VQPAVVPTDGADTVAVAGAQYGLPGVYAEAESTTAPVIFNGGKGNWRLGNLEVHGTEPLSFSASNYPVSETAGSQTITVNRSGSTANAVTVNYATSDGTALGGTDDVQTMTDTAVSGSYQLSFGGATTATLAFNASPSAIQSALTALTSIGSGGVTVTGTSADAVITFEGATLPRRKHKSASPASTNARGEHHCAYHNRRRRTDYITTSGTLTIPAGASSATFTVPIIDVATIGEPARSMSS